MGATDVCPFVPVAGATMDGLRARSPGASGERVGRRAGHPRLPLRGRGDAPGAAIAGRHPPGRVRGALREQARAIRRALPDFGPARFQPRSRRDRDRRARVPDRLQREPQHARQASWRERIAEELRETGKPAKRSAGRDAPPTVPRPLPGAAARVGWYIEEYGRAQVSFNLTNSGHVRSTRSSTRAARRRRSSACASPAASSWGSIPWRRCSPPATTT